MGRYRVFGRGGAVPHGVHGEWPLARTGSTALSRGCQALLARAGAQRRSPAYGQSAWKRPFSRPLRLM